jgi:hypothetical protein
MSNSSTQPVPVISVRVAFDVVSRQWIASTLGELALSVRAHAYPQVRRRIRRLLERTLEREVSVEEALELPLPIARQLRAYQRRHSLWRRLTTYVRTNRLPLAYSLLDLQMNQSDVASLMDVSPAALGTLLERDACDRPSRRSKLASDDIAAE